MRSDGIGTSETKPRRDFPLCRHHAATPEFGLEKLGNLLLA